MRITPKIGEQNKEVPHAIKEYIKLGDSVEIQMLSRDLDCSWLECRDIIDSLRPISNVILHMPFGKHNLNTYCGSMLLQHELLKMLVSVIKYSEQYNAAISFVFHLEGDIDCMYEAGLFSFLRYVLSILRDTNVYIYLENSICNLCSYNPEVSPVETALLAVEDRQLRGCFDLCHYQASCNVLGKSLSITSLYANKIAEVHFSATLNGDGYKDKKATHGKAHSSMGDMIRDLNCLTSLGINLDSILLTVEVSEDDYRHRRNLLSELEMLYAYTSSL